MILDAIIIFLYYLVKTLFAWLPAGSNLPTTWHSAAQYFGGGLVFWNTILPITEIVGIITLSMTIFGSWWLFRLAIWAYGFLRGYKA